MIGQEFGTLYKMVLTNTERGKRCFKLEKSTDKVDFDEEMMIDDAPEVNQEPDEGERRLINCLNVILSCLPS